ncbi:pectate lyase family protein [Steroidobacter agaridevorans]|uniref:pectate lyase family protein n=1 Tax=Steroidobacter agaridevorans TaxID=2695856 RepID=UPI00137B4719|nr:pectate lyase [Steroidobacter agaridevorans]
MKCRVENGVRAAVAAAVAVACLPAARLALADVQSAEAVLAFPGAEGFGRYTKGGRGGKIYKVTNLNDAGPGSLRAAVEAEGPRIVVFDVDGTIRLKSPLQIQNDFITIAGQSAPGGGITLRDYPLQISANEVIVRYLRARMGDELKLEADAVSVGQGRNIVIDHCSVSWSNDETLSVTQRVEPGLKHLTDVTVQWSIISESLNDAGHEKGQHGYGSLIQGSYGARYSFHHNLWAHHEARMPRIGNYAGAKDDPEGIVMDFRNNVFYNWGPGATTDFYNWQPGLERGYNMDPFYGRPDNTSRFAAGADLNSNANTHSNFVNNWYQQGSATGGPVALYIRNASGKTHFAGNYMDGKLVQDQWSLVVTSQQPVVFKTEQPFKFGPVKTESAPDAYKRVLASAGASKSRDAVDERIVASVRDKTGKLINSQKDVGGWPEIRAGVAAADADRDGMPDVWEKAQKLNPKDPANAASIDRAGYSNIERYLNSLVK